MNTNEALTGDLLRRIEALKRMVDARDAFINSQERVIENLTEKGRDLPKESMIHEQSKLIETLQDRIKVLKAKVIFQNEVNNCHEKRWNAFSEENSWLSSENERLSCGCTAKDDFISVFKREAENLRVRVERLQKENEELTREMNEWTKLNRNQKNSIVSKQIEINELRKRLFQAQVNISKQVRNLLKEIDSHLS